MLAYSAQTMHVGVAGQGNELHAPPSLKILVYHIRCCFSDFESLCLAVVIFDK